ncbi:MAG: histidine phosphatase family protein [Bacteroidetes bacterium]|nr:histidine phosphatase family protein [Bacteroidota bacterium]
MTRHLYLVRHAKSSWDNPDWRDVERPLNERGKKDAPKMARRIKEREITPSLMLSSYAKRAIKTCKIFAEVLNCPKTIIEVEERLYHADSETILKVIQEKGGKADHLFLFGHNPGLTSLANKLTGENILNVPTCGVVAIAFKLKDWDLIRFGAGKLKFFDFPKRLIRKD